MSSQNILDGLYYTTDEIINLLPIPAVVVHRNGTMVCMNTRFSDLYLSHINEMIGRKISLFSESSAKKLAEIFEYFDNNKDISTIEVYIYGRYYEVLIEPIYNIGKTVEAVYLLQWNISNIKRAQHLSNQNNKKYKEQMLLDEYTGLPNEYALDSYIDTLIPSNKNLMVILVDIDFFSAYHQEYGFIQANTVLKQIANTLSAELRYNYDFIAKLNSDKFIILLPETSQLAAVTIAERLRMGIYQLDIPHYKGIEHRLTTSVILKSIEIKNLKSINLIIHLLRQELSQQKKIQRNMSIISVSQL